jgi:hypothetical protein
MDDNREGRDHKVHIYLEYQVSVLSSELGHPTPSPASEYVPPGTKERTHSPAGDGVGGPNSDDWKKPSTLSTLCA